MYQSPVALRPGTTRDTLRPRRPVVERIAGWSSRHRKTAVFGWLLPVAALFMAAQAVGTKNLPSYDPGQSGQAERALHQAAPGYYGSAAEVVLIQARAPGNTFSGDASMRQAARQLVTALAALPKSAAGIGSPLTLTARHGDSLPLVSADGHSALVTFNVPGSVRNQDQAVAADQRTVHAVQASHPDLLIAETGDASILRAIARTWPERRNPPRTGQPAPSPRSGRPVRNPVPEPLTAAQKNHTALLDPGVSEPWFLIQGLLLLLAGRWFARRSY